MASYFESTRCIPAQRTAELFRLLCQKSRTPSQLAKILGIGKVTVYRYVWSLQRKGIPIHIWRMKGNGYQYVLDREEFVKWLSGETSIEPQRRKHARAGAVATGR